MQKYPQIQSLKEANLLLGTRRTFGIYQIRDDSPGDNYAFMNMQNHVLPYLQSFCSLEEKGVQERREQQIAEKQDGLTEKERATAETKVKNTKTAGKEALIKRTEDKKVATKAKKPSIHERLEINKRKIQEKQGKDKPERGTDRGVM